jgi:hypothetical protein
LGMQKKGLGICRFSSCDEAATGTVGVVALCLLHQSYVVQLMDHGDGPAGAAARSPDWPLIAVGERDT